ncbi:LPD6B protein, partial [Atractosteus spatula]|nr:LPD6B protein [Atractosteus spatula]
MVLFLALPQAALLPVLLLLATQDGAAAKNINFYNLGPPADPTPFPSSFKCFTCDRAADNYDCNRWAEDKWCPQHTQYCLTVHHFGSRGRSRWVTKKCAAREECQAVGCRHHTSTGHTECVSCCEGMACNVEVPTNHTNAVFAMMKSRGSSAPSVRTWSSASLPLALFTAQLLS